MLYPFTSYTKHQKNSPFARSNVKTELSNLGSFRSENLEVNYLSPTLRLTKISGSSHVQTILLFILNPLLLSLIMLGLGYQTKRNSPHLNKMSSVSLFTKSLLYKIDQHPSSNNSYGIFTHNNLMPSSSVHLKINKEAYNLLALNKLMKRIVPFYYHTLVRFMEHCSGKKSIFKFYPFVHQNVKRDFFVRYRI
jgi:hypothetical protein